jgi:hypothetical protein
MDNVVAKLLAFRTLSFFARVETKGMRSCLKASNLIEEYYYANLDNIALSDIVDTNIEALLETCFNFFTHESLLDDVSLMKEYDFILSGIGELNRIELGKNVDLNKVLKNLINSVDTKEFEKIDHRFRLFYLLRIHELISLNESLMNNFHQLVEELVGLKIYNELFLPSFSLDHLLINMPLDVSYDLVKIIFNYSHLSIHDKGVLTRDANVPFNPQGALTLPL